MDFFETQCRFEENFYSVDRKCRRAICLRKLTLYGLVATNSVSVGILILFFWLYVAIWTGHTSVLLFGVIAAVGVEVGGTCIPTRTGTGGFRLSGASDVNPCPCPCPCRSSPWQVLLLNLACNTHSIVLIVIYLFSVVDFTVTMLSTFTFCSLLLLDNDCRFSCNLQ